MVKGEESVHSLRAAFEVRLDKVDSKLRCDLEC